MIYYLKSLIFNIFIFSILSHNPKLNLNNYKFLNNIQRKIEYNQGSQLKQTLIKFFFNRLTPTLIHDYNNWFEKVPPIKAFPNRTIVQPSIKEMKSNLQRSLISVCATENILFLNCICPHLYHEYQLIKNKQVDSLVTIAVEKKPKLIIISYQPALSYQNYITNSEIPSIDLPTASPGVRVHYGFYTHYLANYFKVREALGKLLDNPNYHNYTLHITGYSLGAGVATIATPDWVQFMKDRNDTRSIQLYVYASPRPGNLGFSKYLSELNIKMGRYNKARDLISNLPTRGFGYTHAVPEIYHNNVGNKSEFVYCDQKFDEDPKCGISQENKVSIWPHILPFNQLVPTPPYC